MAINPADFQFVRDLHPFETLKRHIPPELIVRCGSARALNQWSAACSSGQELYSVAMMMQAFFPSPADWNVHLLGTDLSRDMVERVTLGKATAYRRSG